MRKLVLAALALGMLISAGAWADVDPKVEEQIRQRLGAAMQGLGIVAVMESPLPDVYAVETRSGEILFTTADGKHFILGELFQVSSRGVANVSEQRRARIRADRLAQVDADDLISFKPEGPTKAVINVFTDIDCPYCRKLHSEVPGLNELGIQVNYLAFPRSGPNTPSFAKAVSAWCADDPAAAMTQAKSGQSLPSKTCENPVAEQYRLGHEIGISGTPAIVLEDGRLIGGYMPKAKLAQALGL